MLFLRYLLCLALSAGLALAQPQGGRRTGGGGGEGKIKPTQVPFFILDNPGTPCWKAIEDDEESQEIPLLTGHWGTICESEVGGSGSSDATVSFKDFVSSSRSFYVLSHFSYHISREFFRLLFWK